METILTKSDDSQISEFKLRTLAGLCQYCGMARKYQDTALCEQCFKEEDIASMERRWRKWGIAA